MKFGIFEIIAACLLIITSIVIIALVMMQESTDGMSSVISGDASQSYLNANRGRTKEEKMKKFTKISVAVLMVLTLAVCLVSRFLH